MKVEYKVIGTYTRKAPYSNEIYTVNEYGIYITKNEIIKNYENNREIFIDKLDSLTEMLTSPHCFTTTMWYKDYDYKNGYDYDKVGEIVSMMKKTTVKGLLLYVPKNDDERHLTVKIVKR